MATWLSASAGLPFKPMLKSQPARLVLRSYTITRSRQGWETESRGGKRFVRSLSCLSTRLPGKYVETLSDGTTDLWVKSSASSFSPYTLLHELPFFKTTLKQLSFVSSIHTPFWARHMEPVPPPTPHPPSVPYLSALHNHCKHRLVTWDATVDCHAHARAGTHKRAEIPGCICISI